MESSFPTTDHLVRDGVLCPGEGQLWKQIPAP